MMDIKEGRHLVVAVDDCEVGASSCVAYAAQSCNIK